MRAIVGFLIGILDGAAICAVVFVGLSLAFGTPPGVSDRAGSAEDVAASGFSTPVEPAIAPEIETPAPPQTAPAADTSATPPSQASISTLAFERNALPFAMSPTARGLAVVLIVPPGVDVSALRGLPLTIAVDPATQADQIGSFRAMGFEVLTLLQGETRISVDKLGLAIGTMTGSVGVLDRETTTDPTANILLLALLGQHGLAYVGKTGFGGILAQADEAGLLAVNISYEIQSSQTTTDARLSLERSVQNAMQQGHQIVVVEVDSNMVNTLLNWIDAPLRPGVVLAPVSAVIRAQ